MHINPNPTHQSRKNTFKKKKYLSTKKTIQNAMAPIALPLPSNLPSPNHLSYTYMYKKQRYLDASAKLFFTRV